MAVAAGTRVGAYEIVAAIGAGGMGEVYRATDTKLNRAVAFKVLPASLASDRERVARLRREAEVLAALNHPHIAQIYGLEDSTEVTALVLELVEGPTLADRLAVGPMSIDEVLPIAKQIAEALEAAHERGIVHRDLKPANIKVRPDGTVKVLDFGLAKVVGDEAVRPSSPQMATATIEGTQDGVILGTVAYMSPEQARGQLVDKRTDIWAFGCVLFEMLSARMAFSGQTISDTIAAVLEREPVWDRLPAATPKGIRRLLRRCLEKDPRHRLRDIGDARIELDDALAGSAKDDIDRQEPVGITRRAALTTLVGAAIGTAATGAFAISRYRSAVPRSLTQFAFAVPEGEILAATYANKLSLAPDGRRIAFFIGSSAGVPARLYLRSFRDLESKRIEGIVPGNVFFSPDNRWLGYISAIPPSMRKVALSGGAPVTIFTRQAATGNSGATWADDDTIFFVSEIPGGLMSVPASGGQPREIRKIDKAQNESGLKFPCALPGGHAVLCTVATSASESYDDAQIAAFSVRTGQTKVLVEGGTHARYSPSGHLVYARNGKLFAVRFDPNRLEVTGQPVAVLEGVQMSRNTGVANFDVSSSGDLAYVTGICEGGARTLHWVDRSGGAEKLSLPARSYLHPRISPDARKLAVEIEGANHDCYVYDFASGVLSNITADGVSHWPLWSPDGKTIGFRSGTMGHFRLWQVPADRSRAPQEVVAPGFSQNAESYSPNGDVLAYTATDPNGPTRVISVQLHGDGTPRPLDNSKYAEGSPKFSPDGRWLAYCSPESGKPQVYVQAFPGPGAKTQISSDGGTDPVWKRNGGELFFRNGDSMMAVPVSTASGFTAGRPQELWKGNYSHGMSSSCGPPGVSSSNYDVTADGQHFLMIKDDDQESAVSKQIVVVLGWADELRRSPAKV
jgi:serine/threonine-protein kinase